MKKVWVILLLSVFIVAGLGYLALSLRPDAKRNANEKTTVRIYCAAGIAKPVEQIVNAYNEAYQANIEIVRTGGSGELAGLIKTESETGLVGGADLYITADDFLLKKAHDEGIVAEQFSLAEQRPVIAVTVQSGREINNINALVVGDLRFGIASERAAVGKLARKIADRENVGVELEEKKATDSENVMTLAQALATGSLDAAIIWDTTVNQVNQANGRDVLKIAAVADRTNKIKSNIAAGVIASTESPTPTLRFARYLNGSTKAREAFEQFGFTFLPGDQWEEFPEIHLYCGSMFTPVLENSVREFAKREGVNIYPRWQGCGKLVASINGTEDPELFPDAFLACDESFLDRVQEHFLQPMLVSTNDIVIAARSESKFKVDDLTDLLQEKIRVGICEPDQSALGLLTKRLLDSIDKSTYRRLTDSASVMVDVGPTLISQLRAGGLDAAIVYRSNVMAETGDTNPLRIVEIDSELAQAKQPWAVSKQTRNPQLMQRFYLQLRRAELAQRFKKFGFVPRIELP